MPVRLAYVFLNLKFGVSALIPIEDCDLRRVRGDRQE